MNSYWKDRSMGKEHFYEKSLCVFAFLLALAAALLTVSAFADTGPKAQLKVLVKNAPEEPYYLDLLEKGDYQGHTYGSGDGMTHTAGWIGATPRRRSLHWTASCWTRCGRRCRRAGTPAPRRAPTVRPCGAPDRQPTQAGAAPFLPLPWRTGLTYRIILVTKAAKAG